MADNEYMMGYLSGQSDNKGCNNGGLFGGGWEGIIGLVVILALLGGGFGWGGGFGGFGGGAGLQGMATRADINEGFALNNITGGITAIQQGICDSTYALNNTITNGFHGVDRGLCDLGYALKDCCCQTQRAIDGVNYNLATQTAALQNTMCGNTRDIIDATNAGTRAVLDFLTQDKIATLTAENQSLKFAASQSRQNDYLAAVADAKTAELIRRLGADCPTPAYVVQPPTPVNFPTNACGTFNGWGGNCGCNNGYAYAA